MWIELYYTTMEDLWYIMDSFGLGGTQQKLEKDKKKFINSKCYWFLLIYNMSFTMEMKTLL